MKTILVIALAGVLVVWRSRRLTLIWGLGILSAGYIFATNVVGMYADIRYTFYAIVPGLMSACVALKEAQNLARHASPGLTLNVYARSRDVRRVELAEAVGQIILGKSLVARTGEPEVASAYSSHSNVHRPP